jgi:DNA-binding IclR family transcriptional regulator
LSKKVLDSLDLPDLAKPHMRQLSDVSNETVHLSVLDDYAIDNEENEEGVRCVGAPIFDRSGRVFAAISVSGPSYRLSVSRLHALSSLVIDSANAISGHLGYVP